MRISLVVKAPAKWAHLLPEAPGTVVEAPVGLMDLGPTVLSMAGVGFDRTRLTAVADPALKFNTHFIAIRGKTGRVDIKFESVAMPENPKTSMLACFSALAAIRELGRSTRYGT